VAANSALTHGSGGEGQDSWTLSTNSKLKSSSFLDTSAVLNSRLRIQPMIKMAGVFMTSTSTIAIYAVFAPRWLAVLGCALALVLLFGSYHIRWSFITFPVWVFTRRLYFAAPSSMTAGAE
jgi:hypothetical protein